jgi:DNA topoisomerase-1
VIEGKKKLIAELKAAAKGMDSVYLAADPDREGEAICFTCKRS